MHELIPPALVMLLGGMLNVVLSGPIASLDAAIFRGLGFPKSFIEFWGSEVVIRSAGWIAIVVSFALLVVGLFGG